MYGSNYYGQSYYGQGPAVGTTFTLQTVSATVTTTASISSILLINKIVSATVTTTASIVKQFQRTLTATAIVATATFSSIIVKALNIRRATTKLLVISNTSRMINGIRATFGLNIVKTTKDTTDD